MRLPMYRILVNNTNFHPILHQDTAGYWSNFRCRQDGASLLTHSYGVNPQF